MRPSAEGHMPESCGDSKKPLTTPISIRIDNYCRVARPLRFRQTEIRLCILKIASRFGHNPY